MITFSRGTRSLFTVGLCLVQPAGIRRVASARKGAQSHRAFDEVPALSRAGQGLAISGRYGGAWCGSRH